MAAVDIYTDSLVEAGKKGNPANIMPGQVFGFACTFETGVGDTTGSVYRICPNIGANMIPIWLKLNCDAAVDITSAVVGLYRTAIDGGAVVDYDCFLAATDIGGGYITFDTAELGCLVSLPIADAGKKLWEITSVKAAGSYTDADHPTSFDLALTSVTQTGAIGTISFRGLFIQG
jgi:hypothetical protein